MRECSKICLALLVMGAISLFTKAQLPKSEPSKGRTNRQAAVVFVCEHGVAKSVIAAAHFNRLARERNLNLRAIARGTSPEDEIPSNVVTGLQADGLRAAEKRKKLATDDVIGSRRVIAFCKLPDDYDKKTAVEQWNDVPPVSEDYLKAWDAIVGHIKRLLDELQGK